MLGQLSLNLSFLMYAILYLPQIIHNQKQADLAGLSKWMHILLYAAYSLDLLYGFATHLPWQYRLISGLGWLLLSIQHLQIMHHFNQNQRYGAQYSYYGLLLLFFVFLLYGLSQQPFSPSAINIVGYLAQLGFVIAIIPQILKSKQLKSTHAINVTYLMLNMVLSCLDLISAWQLNWGWPNKCGSSLLLILTSVLLLQYRIYPSTKEHMTNPN